MAQTLDRLKCFIASGLGSGLLKPAPGTWGSLAALFLLYILLKSPLTDSLYYPLSVFTLICSLLNQWVAAAAVDRWGKDPGEMVMDEWAGLGLSFALFYEFLPMHTLQNASLELVCLTHFVLFRFFDITKILGLNRLQQFSGGLGILLDDLAAGIYSGLLSYAIFSLFFGH